jgi:hypothetical protein
MEHEMKQYNGGLRGLLTCISVLQVRRGPHSRPGWCKVEEEEHQQRECERICERKEKLVKKSMIISKALFLYVYLVARTETRGLKTSSLTQPRLAFSSSSSCDPEDFERAFCRRQLCVSSLAFCLGSVSLFPPTTHHPPYPHLQHKAMFASSAKRSVGRLVACTRRPRSTQVRAQNRTGSISASACPLHSLLPHHNPARHGPQRQPGAWPASPARRAAPPASVRVPGPWPFPQAASNASSSSR